MARTGLWSLLALVLSTGASRAAEPYPEECRAILKKRGSASTPEVTFVPVAFASPEDLLDRATEMLSRDPDGEVTGTVVVDERSNSLMVYDVPSVVCRIKALVRKYDVPTPQVKLRMRAYRVPASLKESDKAEWLETQGPVELTPALHAEIRIGKWKGSREELMSSFERNGGVSLCGQFQGVGSNRRSMSMWGCLDPHFAIVAKQPAVAGLALQLEPSVQTESSSQVLIEDLQWYGQPLLEADPAAMLLGEGEALVISVTLQPQGKRAKEKDKEKPVSFLVALTSEVIAPQAMND